MYIFNALNWLILSDIWIPYSLRFDPRKVVSNISFPAVDD